MLSSRPRRRKPSEGAAVLLATTMADRGVDLSALPKEVRDQLAELDLELSEGKLAGTRLGEAATVRDCLNQVQFWIVYLCEVSCSCCCCCCCSSGTGRETSGR